MCSRAQRATLEVMLKQISLLQGRADKDVPDAYDECDARPCHFSYFLNDYKPDTDKGDWEEGMKCEILDLIPDSAKPHEFRIATVRKRLGRHWLMVQCDDYDPREDEKRGDPLEYYPIHVRSPYLLPLGTCKAFDLPMAKPKLNGSLMLCEKKRIEVKSL